MMTAQISILKQIAKSQSRYQLFPTPEEGMGQIQVVVGVSGGMDSICLLHVLKALAAEWHLSLHIAHLDHNIRPNSQIDAAFVEQLAMDWKLPYHSHRLPPHALQNLAGGLESAARQARYAFLCEVAQSVTPSSQTPIVAVAHHADDQAETVLMNFLRGSGPQGLGGMRQVNLLSEREVGQGNVEMREDARSSNIQALIDENVLPCETSQNPLIYGLAQYRQIRLIRPLLDIARSEIEHYAAVCQLSWREDETNQDDRFLRNRLRHEVMPLLKEINPNLAETLGRTAHIFQDESERIRRLYLEKFTEVRIAPQVDESFDDEVAHILLNLDNLLALDIASQRGVLRHALQQLQHSLRDIHFDHIETLIHRLQEGQGVSGPHPLFGDISWTVLSGISISGASASAALVSLHRRSALPFPVNQPYLDEQWQAEKGEIEIPASGEIHTPNGWVLSVRQVSYRQLPSDWKEQGQGWTAYLDAERLGRPILTVPKPTLQFAPLGMKGHRKRLGDFFTDRKIPVVLRTGWPLIVDKESERIGWVCGLLPADDVKITEQTEQVLHCQWTREAA